MRGRKRRAPAVDLSRAALRFEQWRQGRVTGSRIPAGLWKLALNVAGRHGVARTAAALRLDYYSLKKRLVARPSPAGDTEYPSPPPAFVELLSLVAKGRWRARRGAGRASAPGALVGRRPGSHQRGAGLAFHRRVVVDLLALAK